MQNIDNLLAELGACKSATLWAQGKTWQQIYDTCERADWLLWLFARTQTMDAEVNMRLFTLAKVECAALVDPIWFNDTHLGALNAARQFANGAMPLNIWLTYRVEFYCGYRVYGQNAALPLTNQLAYTCLHPFGLGEEEDFWCSTTPSTAALTSWLNHPNVSTEDKQKILADTIRRVLPFHIWELSDPMFSLHLARMKQFNS